MKAMVCKDKKIITTIEKFESGTITRLQAQQELYNILGMKYDSDILDYTSYELKKTLYGINTKDSLISCLDNTKQSTTMTKENVLPVSKVYEIITHTFNNSAAQISKYVDFITPFGSSTLDKNTTTYGDIDIAIFLKPGLTDKQKKGFIGIMPSIQATLTQQFTEHNIIPLFFKTVIKEPAKTKKEELLLHRLVYCYDAKSEQKQEYTWIYNNVVFGIESLWNNPPTVINFLRQEIEKNKNSSDPSLFYGTISSDPIPKKVVDARSVIAQRYGRLHDILSSENSAPGSLATAMKYFAYKQKKYFDPEGQSNPLSYHVRFSADTHVFTNRYNHVATTGLRKYAEGAPDAPHPKHIAQEILKLLEQGGYTYTPSRKDLENG